MILVAGNRSSLKTALRQRRRVRAPLLRGFGGFVEGEGDDGCVELIFSSVDGEIGADLRMFFVDIGHGDGFAQGWGHAARSHFADVCITHEDGHILTGGAFGVDLKAYEGDGWAAGFVFFGECFLADECLAVGLGGFIEVHGKGHVDGMGGDVFAEFMTIEGEPGFEAEGVAGGQAARLEIKVGLDRNRFFLQQTHSHLDGRGREEDFDAVLAGVASAGDEDFHNHHVFGDEAEAFEFGDFFGDRTNELHNLGPLDGNHGGLFSATLKLDFEAAVVDDGVHMSDNLVSVGTIDDDKKIVGFEAHDDDIIEYAAGFVAHEGVSTLALLHSADAAGADALKELGGVFAFDREPAHMGDIKE